MLHKNSGGKSITVGFPEQPITNRMKYGKVRKYKCRRCGRVFKDYYLPEEKRVCVRCAEKNEQS